MKIKTTVTQIMEHKDVANAATLLWTEPTAITERLYVEAVIKAIEEMEK